jgi:hypothetical protein
VKVLQAVVREDDVKMARWEWKLRCVRLGKTGHVNVGTFQVNPDDGNGTVV